MKQKEKTRFLTSGKEKLNNKNINTEPKTKSKYDTKEYWMENHRIIH